MIIKGTSRGNPKQLAAHLLRSDTNERIKILELNSPTDSLADTLREWQALTAATGGKKGLYHANISPDAGYAMSPEQWERAADLLAETLGLSHQPRTVILHEKDGREHIHVVWQRTDTATMTLVSDSWNYLAHEKASLALEMEFGHELVPGKHAKRDRELQPEFPRAEATHDEWQQAERAGITPAERKEEITALFQQCDSGQAFKAALAEQGYILAQGDRRDYVIVDAEGEVHSLGRQIKDLKAKELRAFMTDVDRDTLPTVEQAKDLTTSRVHTPTEQQPLEQPKEQPQSPPDTSKEDLAAVEQALKARQEQERRDLRERHKAERLDLTGKLEASRAMQEAELARYFRKPEEFTDEWVRKFIDIKSQRWNPDIAAQRRLERREQIEEIRTRHRIERETLIETQKLQREQEIEDLKARHAQQQQPKPTEQPIEQPQAQTQTQQPEPPKPPQPVPAPEEPSHKLTEAEIAALAQAVTDRQEKEAQKLKNLQSAEMNQLRFVLDQDIAEKMENFDALQAAERNRKHREIYPEEPTGMAALKEALKHRLNPAAAAEARAERDRQWEALTDRQQQKRADKLDGLARNKQQEIDDLQERHAQKLRERKAQAEKELQRYIREEEAARRLLSEEQERRLTEERVKKMDGPDPPSLTR